MRTWVGFVVISLGAFGCTSTTSGSGSPTDVSTAESCGNLESPDPVVVGIESGTTKTLAGGDLLAGHYVLTSANTRGTSSDLTARKVGLVLDLADDGTFSASSLTSTGVVEQRRGNWAAASGVLRLDVTCGPNINNSSGAFIDAFSQTAKYEAADTSLVVEAGLRFSAGNTSGWSMARMTLERQ